MLKRPENMNPIDELFREGLANHQTPPPPRLWKGIAAQRPTRKPFYQNWQFTTLLVATALFLGGIGGYYLALPTQKTNRIDAITIADSPPEGQNIAPPSANLQSKAQPTAATENSILKSGNDIDTDKNAQRKVNTAKGVDTEPLSAVNDQSDANANSTLLSRWKNKSGKKSQSLLNSTMATAANIKANSNLLPSSTTSYIETIDIAANKNKNTDFTQPLVANLKNTDPTPAQAKTEALATLPKLLASTANNDNKTTINALEHNLPQDQNPSKANYQAPIGLWVGSFVNGGLNWIVSPNAMQNPRANLVAAQPSAARFGWGQGLSAGYNFSRNFGVQVEYIGKTSVGQNYKMTATNKYRDNSLVNNGLPAKGLSSKTRVNLVYTQIPVLVKFRTANLFLKSSQLPATISVLAGIQYSKLKAAAIKIDNYLLQEQLLNQHQYAIALGAEMELYLTRNYFLTFASRASFGATTPNSTEASIPFAKNNATLINWGLRAGINYRFAPTN